MSDDPDPHGLRVDRLAKAMEAARARAREAASGDRADAATPKPADPPRDAPAPTPLRAKDGLDAAGEDEAPPKAAAPTAPPAAPVAIDHDPATEAQAPPPPAARLLVAPQADAAAPRAAEAAASPHAGPVLLSFDEVSVRGHLHGLSFQAVRGEMTALIARNPGSPGAALEAAMGLAPITGGAIRFAGDPVTGFGPARLARAGCGFAPSAGGVFASLTVAENVALGRRGRRVPQDRLDWIFRTFPALVSVWHHRADRLPRALCRMVALARVLADRHRLYLLDGPFAGLPDADAERLRAALRDLKWQGATILVSTTDPADLGTLPARVVLLEGGRNVWCGAHADLYAGAAAGGPATGADT